MIFILLYNIYIDIKLAMTHLKTLQFTALISLETNNDKTENYNRDTKNIYCSVKPYD